MSVLVHAVMCGGAGTRLWPLSRRDYPKQFMSVAGERSLLQATAERMAGLSLPVRTLALGNEEHRFLIADQLDQASTGVEIILEPHSRGTAPVALVAALQASARYGREAVVLLAAADHRIADPAAYLAAVERAVPAARAGHVVTFGVEPTAPETGYGYMERGDPLKDIAGAFAVARFQEKPDLQAARGYLARGGYYWNAGIFLFEPQTVIDLAGELEPEMLAACRRALERGRKDLGFLRLDPQAWHDVALASFDNAFAERWGRIGAIVPVAMEWSDLGAWPAVHDVLKDGEEGGNGARGPVELFECSDVLALSEGPLLVVQGVSDLVVVADRDAVYVGRPAASRQLGRVVDDLVRRGYRAASSHERVYRPWGWYQTINAGSRFQVKEIVVKPGGQLSLQAHHHRAEHWVVVRGTARVSIDGEERTVTENESVFIPLGARHRLENPGRIPMHLIEVQTGSYLEEDDIVRFDDRYGRS